MPDGTTGRRVNTRRCPPVARETRPLRNVVAAFRVDARGSVLGGDTARRVRMWRLELDCGHRVQRPCRYPPAPDRPRANGWHPRLATEVLPASARARCDTCPEGDPR